MYDWQKIEYAWDHALWSFETPCYLFVYMADKETMAPEDSLEFEDDIEAVRSGHVDWFCALMLVFDKRTDEYVSHDVLGGCAYTTARSFAEGGNRDGYFRHMVRQCISSAREREVRLSMCAA